MPIIQDPRMNQGNEKDYGIAYFESDFKIRNNDYIAGHYFYRKDIGNPNDPFNARYLPHGFPIIATQRTGGTIPLDDIEIYRTMFPNLIYNIILRVERDPNYNDEQLDSRVPMAAYLNRVISNRTTGLGQFDHGTAYRYERDGTQVVSGRMEPIQD